MTPDGGGRARRELELKIKFVADKGQANQAMNELAASAEKVERAAARANRAMGATPAGGGTPFAFTGGGALMGLRPGGGGGVGAVTGLDALGKRFGPIGGGKAGKFDIGDALGGGVGGQLAENLAGRFGIPTTGTMAAAGAAGVAAIAYQGAKTTRAAVDAWNDRYASEQVRERRVLASIPLGSTALGYIDSFTGRAAGIRDAAEDHRIRLAEQQAREQIQTQEYAGRYELAGARETARQLSSARATNVPYSDRTTAEGERQYRLDVQRAQLSERAAAADRRAATARSQMEESTRQMAEIDAQMRANENRRGGVVRARDNVDNMVRQAGNEAATDILKYGATNPFTATLATLGAGGAFLASRTLDVGAPLRQELELRNQELINANQALAGRRAGVSRQWQTAGVAREAAIAEAAAARGPEMMRLEAAALEDRAGRALAGRVQLGTSSQDAKEDALYAMREIMAGGIENADPAEIAAARAFFPERIDALGREAAGRDPLLAEFAAIDPQKYGDDPDALFRQGADIRNRAGEQDIGIQAVQAEVTAKIIEQFGAVLVEGMKAFIPLIPQLMESEFRAQRNAGAGVQ